MIAASSCGSIKTKKGYAVNACASPSSSLQLEADWEVALRTVSMVQAATGQGAHLVGGALRDLLLGKQPEDLDFVVTGEGVEFAREVASKLLGRLVVFDVPYDESRVVFGRGKILDFSGRGDQPVEEELARRDFTINAIAVELVADGKLDRRLIDPYHGQHDLEARIVRAVTPRSLEEDPLRILRAYRLAAQFGLTIEGVTRKQMRRLAKAIDDVPGERIREELLKLLSTDTSFPQIESMKEDGLLTLILPLTEGMADSAAGHYEGDNVMVHSLRCLWRVEELIGDPEGTVFQRHWPIVKDYLGSHPWKVALVKLGALLHDVAKPRTQVVDNRGRLHFYGHDRIGSSMVEQMLKGRLRFSTREIRTVVTLVNHHMWPHLLAREQELSERAIRKFFRTCGDESIGLLLLAIADALASGSGYGVAHLESAIDCMLRFQAAEGSRRPRKRLITGNDLIDELGLTPGPLFRTILQQVEEQQDEGSITTREEALEVARRLARTEHRGEKQ